MKRSVMFATSVASATALTLGLVVPSSAEEVPSGDVESTLTQLTEESTSASTDVLDNVADVPTDAVGATAIDAEINGVDVTVPTDPSNPIELESSSGDFVSIELPFSDEASSAEVVTDGVVAYDNNNASTTAPVVKDDGSLQVTTIIEDPSAPIEYVYQLELPEGTQVSELEGGALVFLAPDGSFVGGVAAPWAEDANGHAVPTQYLVDGSTLTQVVEHRTEGFAYPIVADPWMGINLFQFMVTGIEKNEPRYMLYRSVWGAMWSTNAGSSPIFLTAGWAEASSRWPVLNSKPSLRQQYDCHAIYALLKPDSWNLEKFRVNKSNWGASALSHFCNWTG